MWLGLTVIHLKASISSSYTRYTWCDWVSRTRRYQCHNFTRISLCDWVSPWCTRRLKCHPCTQGSHDVTGSYCPEPKGNSAILIGSQDVTGSHRDALKWESVIHEYKVNMMWLSLTMIHSEARVSSLYTSVTRYGWVSLWHNLRQECNPFIQKSHHLTGFHCDALEGESVILEHKGHMMWLHLIVMQLKAWVSS